MTSKRGSKGPRGVIALSLPEGIVDSVLSCKSLKEAMESKELAKLGDALLGLMNVLGMEAGYLANESKVTNKLLKRVSVRTGIRSLLPKRMDRRHIGNAVEAAVAYWLVAGDLSWDGILQQLKEGRGLEDALVAEITRIDGAMVA